MCAIVMEGLTTKPFGSRESFYHFIFCWKEFQLCDYYHIGLKSLKNYFKNPHFMKFLWREQSNIYKHKASDGGNKTFQRNCTFFVIVIFFPFLVQCVSIVGLCGHVEKEDIQSICTNYVDNVKYCGKFNLLSIKTYLVIRSDISMEVQSEGLIMYMKKNLSKKTFWNMEN